MLELRPYQRAAIDGLYNYWADRKGDNPVIVAPTGSGKSLIIAHLIKDAMSYTGTRVLMLTHVKELIQQILENKQVMIKRILEGKLLPSNFIHYGKNTDMHGQ